MAVSAKGYSNRDKVMGSSGSISALTLYKEYSEKTDFLPGLTL